MKLFKKVLPLALVLSMILSTFVPVLAAVDQTQNITEADTGNTEVFYTQESSFGVTIPKKITLGTNKTSDYTVTVAGDISSNEVIFVVPDESFLMKDMATTGTIKADVPATVEQDKTEWKFNEFETIGNGLVEAPGLTAGNWAGTFYFNVKFNDCNITVNATDENGENLNATATNIVGKEKDALLEKLVESDLVSEEDEIAALINVKSDNFEGIADTTFNVSNIAETGEKVAILHYDTEKGIWELIGIEEVKEDGTVAGDFTSYSPVAFVKINSDGSYDKYLVPGLYDDNDNLIVTWEESGLDLSIDHPYYDYINKDNSSGYHVLNRTYTSATKIIMPDDITHIGGNSFRGCSKLKYIKLSDNVTKISSKAFSDCYALETVIMPSKLTYVGTWAFNECEMLNNIQLYKCLTTLEQQCFYACSSLTNVYYEGTEEEWDAFWKKNTWNSDSPTTIYFNTVK